jgi:signal transduction histidine kinase
MAHHVWYRSLYWRIALGFIACVAGLLAAQALALFWLTSRESEPGPAASPRHVAAFVAAELSSALDADPALDVARRLRDQFGSGPHRVLVIFEDGRVLRNRSFEPPEALVRFARRRLLREPLGDDGLGGRSRRGRMGDDEGLRRPALIPLVVDGRTVGVVTALPGGPPLAAAVRAYAPRLAAVAVGLLVVGTGVMAFFVFNPARRRLRALERAARAIGSGESGVRAPEDGGDEVAVLATAFNRMADELERRIEESDRSRRQLLADVSHELMTPLTAIRGYLETLGMPQAIRHDADRERYLRIVMEETERLTAIVGDLLDLARLEGGGATLSLGAVSIDALFARAVERHEVVVRSKDITLDVEVEPGAGTVVGDERRLEQVVQNLVANAVRHTPRGGRVALAAQRGNGRVRIRVLDTGPGIPPEHLPRVFDRFHRVDSARDQASGGSGLGLSIVRAIVERHGGTVSVSNEPGAGACFDVTLQAG